MDNFNVYLIVSPEECIIDKSKLIIKKKLPYVLNIKNYEVALTEFTTSKFQCKYTLVVSDMVPLGISFSNILGYFTVKIDLINDYSLQIQDQISSLIKAYYYYIYENMYHNLENLTKIPQHFGELFIISNANYNNIACYNKIGYLDGKKNYATPAEAKIYKDIATSSNIIDPTFIKIREYKTFFTKEFMSKKFEEYTPLELTKFLEYYHEKIPEEFKVPKIEFTCTKIPGYSTYTVKLTTAIEPKPKFTIAETDQILINNEEIFIEPPKINALLFESDIVPVQYVNNQLKNVLKIIHYGDELIPYQSKDYYQKVIKPFMNTINITITSYSNLILPEEILSKDYIYINLHFKK